MTAPADPPCWKPTNQGSIFVKCPKRCASWTPKRKNPPHHCWLELRLLIKLKNKTTMTWQCSHLKEVLAKSSTLNQEPRFSLSCCSVTLRSWLPLSKSLYGPDGCWSTCHRLWMPGTKTDEARKDKRAVSPLRSHPKSSTCKLQLALWPEIFTCSPSCSPSCKRVWQMWSTLGTPSPWHTPGLFS